MDLIVHGGAGSAPEEPEPRQRALDAAATAGTAENSPLDAVEVAVRALEHDPRFNAGVGSSVQADGIPRTDAGVMTSDRSIGAAASMPGVEHAVTVARVVMEETPHVQIAGVHAVDLAEQFGVPVEVDLWCDRTREHWDDLGGPPRHLGVQVDWVNEQYGEADSGGGEEGPTGTVGAVAREDEQIAAATSTGGRWAALAGRVGDVPQVGSGFFATEAAGASATGAGEDIVRTTVAKEAVGAVEDGMDADAAATAAIDAFGDHATGTAGVIVADADGRLGSAFDSEAMQTATARR
ncbi:asparaginase [Salinarchaeum sp. Harcht-Bsk1]|uniref:isoaspartyl peptidase/L-asparaginase n=1 Tax=Salinarchaeum sp. Harcht-Bsk1 TaxID=1333523 RepID=UPI00034229DB|nr:isoaspartyl peptidase/L-asparaginase [Salinarchaeum sp. Harcht-Bsk1]AGN00523.1 asparaginase [Salinarchaeum sp. Harcht-Bsk1]